MNSAGNNYYRAIGYLACLTPLATLHVLSLLDFFDACLAEEDQRHIFDKVKEDFFSAYDSIRKSPFKALRNITIGVAAGVTDTSLAMSLYHGIPVVAEIFRLCTGSIQSDGIVCVAKHLAEQPGFTRRVLVTPLIKEIENRYLFQDKVLNKEIVKKAFKYDKLSSFKQTCLRVTVASAIFALGHLDNGHHPTLRSLWPQFLIGIVNGCLYESAGLIPSIAAHSASNLVTQLTVYALRDC